MKEGLLAGAIAFVAHDGQSHSGTLRAPVMRQSDADSAGNNRR